MATKRKPAATPPARRRQVVPVVAVRRNLPRGMAWCGKCAAPAPEEGGERTRHGFFFCAAHR